MKSCINFSKCILTPFRFERSQSCAPSETVDELHCKFHCEHSCITWQVLYIIASPPSVTMFKTAKYLLHQNSATELSGITKTGEKKYLYCLSNLTWQNFLELFGYKKFQESIFVIIIPFALNTRHTSHSDFIIWEIF